MPALSGIPQGSVISLLMFLIYINDLFDGIHSSSKQFADDAKIYRRVRNGGDFMGLQEDVDKL